VTGVIGMVTMPIVLSPIMATMGLIMFRMIMVHVFEVSILVLRNLTNKLPIF